MLLHNVMLGRAILALLLAIAAGIAVVTRRHAGEGAEEPPKAIFDFSAGQVEGRQMQEVLTEALSRSATDAEFE